MNNRTFFDLALQHYGNIQSVFDIAMMNDVSITADFDGDIIVLSSVMNTIIKYYNQNHIIPATNINNDDNEYIEVDDTSWRIINKYKNNLYNKRKDRQTVFDYSIQQYGDIGAAFKISKNNDISVTDEQPVRYFNYNLNVDEKIFKYYLNRRIKPATDIDMYDYNDVVPAYYTRVRYIIPDYSGTKYYRIPCH